MLSRSNALALVTAPAAEPISTTDAKQQMRVEHSDDDMLIARLVGVAIRTVDAEGMLGAAMISQTWGESFGKSPGTVPLAMGPVQSVSAVKYYDADNALQTATLSDFDVLGPSNQTIVRPKPGKTWPSPLYDRDDAIQIQYVCGYGDAASDVPQTVRHALLMLVAHWYENREPELVGSISKTIPFGFADLLNLERAEWYG